MGFMTAPATAPTLTAQGVANLIPQLFNQKLANESVLGSVWDKLSSMITVDKDQKVSSIPDNSVMLKLDTTLNGKIPSRIQLGMLQPYQNCPRLGTAQTILGNEEATRWKEMTAFYNEIKMGVSYFGWGYNSNEQEFYGLLKTITPRVISYFSELHDQRIQEAILMTYEKCLTVAPLTANLQQFNPNWFIPNTAVCNQPAYDHHDDTIVAGTCPTSDVHSGNFPEILGDALFASTNSGANPEYCNLMIDGLLGLEQYLEETVKMPTVKVAGKDCRVYVMPSSQAKTLKDPRHTISLGTTHLAGLPADILSWPGVIGMVGSLLIVENLRYPTLTLGGANQSWTLQPGFLYPGNNDGRNMACWGNTSGSLNYVFHIGYVLGPNAVLEWVANSLRYNLKEMTEYEQIMGQAAYTCAGIQIVKYDNDTETDLSYYCNSSCIVPVAAPQVMNLQ